MKHTPGPWQLWTSNSWRRIVSRDHGSVCEPIVQNDGHPDLHFKNGGEDGPDARLLQAAPDMLEALRHAVMALAYAAENEPTFQGAYDRVDAAIRLATVKS